MTGTIDKDKLLEYLEDMRQFCLKQSSLLVIADPELSTRYDGRYLMLGELIQTIEEGGI